MKKKHHSLSGRLAKYTIIAALVIGTLFSVVQILLDVVDERSRTRATMNQIIKTVTPLAASAAYELNAVYAQELLSGLFAYGPVSYAEISGDRGPALAQMQRPKEERSFSKLSSWIYADLSSYEIPLLHKNYHKPVGFLTVIIDTAYLGEGVAQRALTTIIFGTIRNIVLALVLIFIFQWFLTRPLIRLSKNFSDLDLNSNAEAQLQYPENHEDDELGDLTNTINKYLSERQVVEEQLRRSQKMEAIGQLTGGIAHDFNNILGIVIGNLEILQELIKDDNAAAERIKKAMKGGLRGAALTRKLLSFSRQDMSVDRLVSINEFVGGMEGLLTKSLTVSVDMTTLLGKNLWPVKIDPGDLEDAILNLSLNARDAMPDGGKLIIETSNKVISDDYVIRNVEATAGEFVMFSVSDTGQGMTPEVRDKVMDPFFTTKKEGKGTGLGLSMVYGFVKRSGGHIKIYSEIGEGTTIRIYLPRAQDETDIAQNETQSEVIPTGNETILVVDDEEALLDVAVLHLESLGYKTISAQHGIQALKILADNKDIDMLFTDVIMPKDMDGYELALAAHKLNPALKVLITSGFTKHREKFVNGEGKYISKLVSTLLSKPYNKSELAIAVRNTLDEDVSLSQQKISEG